MKTIYDFESKEKPSASKAGGKAIKLMEMYDKSLPVPPGLVLTTDFFAPWTSILKESDEWQQLSSGNDETMCAAASKLNTLCSGFGFNLEQKTQFDEAFSVFQQEFSCTFFAVRSSSPEEDMDSASFAGGYETVLGVTIGKLEEAIVLCYASCFHPRVFSYKKEHGIPTDNPCIAVLIQQQLDADCAGVGFSINPVNNCFDEAVINANFGLGESVVSGETEPDMFVVDKVRRAIAKKYIGGKQLSVTLNDNGGTVNHVHGARSEVCIDERQALDIAALICTVEELYQMPMDIEWAIADGRLYLLQVRPITTYHPLPDEMLTKPGEKKRLYANCTLIEQGIDEPLSVLGTDFTQYVLRQMGGIADGDIVGIDGMTFTAGGQYYMNLSNSMQSGGKKIALAPGSSDDETVLAILDSIDLSEYRPKQLSVKVKKARRGMVRSALPMIKSLMHAMKNPEAFMDSYYKELPTQLARFTQITQECRSLKEHTERLTGELHFFLMKYGMPTMFGAYRARKSIANLFEGVDVEDNLAHIELALPNNKTTEMGEALYKIAASEEIQRYSDEDAFLSALKSGEFREEFVSSWQGFIEEFGARCPMEIDVATPRPKENPGVVFEQSKRLSHAINSGSESFFTINRKKREAAYHTLLAAARRMGKSTARQFEKNYRILYNFGGFRESGKQYITKAVDLFRQEALALGRRFVSEGRLDNAEQVFGLSIDDIDRASTDPNMELRKLIQERTTFTDRLRRSHFTVRIIDSRGKIFMPPVNLTEDGGFSGIAISPGVVRGRAKILHTATEKTLLLGEILVARATDPGWTPLFISAKGIVLEIGGALQHGAVVAREYGIPCVSGITDATELISDGQLIEIDGSNGIVKILNGEKSVYPPVSEARNSSKSEKSERAKKEKMIRRIKQTVLMMIPVVLSPFLVLFMGAVLFILVKLILGAGVLQSIHDFKIIIQTNFALISLSTWVVALVAVVFALWHKRKKIGKIIKKVFTRKATFPKQHNPQ